MKKIKSLKKWGIYELNEKERLEYGFNFAVIHPNNMGSGLLSPRDSDIEIDTLEGSIDWVNNY
ncbi:hypothetical protein REC12_15505 [Desulfosporosinus sp. PR]|uniref:hypothetical protein n=1 Tax=Candidatus Desulfosporosinus nitrosoreducens TaxID=3401928 RepID=UPI0027F58322|nr:hypothetical protein [Desulfosporosinus sp. PR]MDQ7095002.1 hypothetical protein [Desulfosporosinus sp. PR]